MRGTNVTCSKCKAQMPAQFSFCGKCGARLAPLESIDGQTKHVTVLFADISEFTALAERLDPEELHENMRAAWDAIAADIRDQGGLIEKYIGDAVVAVFGAVEAQEDHPERAQHAALAILGALERENERIAERTGRHLALRVGINTGLAVAGAIGDEVLADPRAFGARVARARCSPYDQHRAYGAVADLLRRALAISPSAPTEIAHRMISETLPGIEPEAAKLVLAALGYGLTLPPLSGDTKRKLLDRAVRDLILRVARSQPVILALTDVQWADRASQDLLAALAPSLGGASALVITTYRPELTPPWSTSRGHLQIGLTPLDATASATLLQTLLPQGALPSAAIDDLVARRAGNPTYLEEAARWIAETGLVVERDGARPLADVSRLRDLPEGLPILLLRRADQATLAEDRKSVV